MGLLHKNLILAGIASVAMVGFLNSSSASALDGFSFSDVINNYRNQTEQLQPYLTNPFGSECEAANPNGAISCNQANPKILFNLASSEDTLWGHDGSGIVFDGDKNLVNGNSQLRTARRGDSISFSVEMNTKRFYDDAETQPITGYSIGNYISDNLTLDTSSVVVKVGNQVLPEEAYQIHSEELPDDVAAQYGFRTVAGVDIEWGSQDGVFKYDDGERIELLYSATVNDGAKGSVFVRAGYAIEYFDGKYSRSDERMFEESIMLGKYQATIIVDGSIIIRRVDESDNPVSGAKYIIDGVRASQDALRSSYIYDEKGRISEFTTDKNGEVIILNVPDGNYTVTEISSPSGEPMYQNITKEVNINSSNGYRYQKAKLLFFGMMDVGQGVSYFDDGSMSLQMEDMSGTLPLTYDADADEYTASINSKTHRLKRTDDGYDMIVDYGEYSTKEDLMMKMAYDTTRDAYVAKMDVVEFFGNAAKAEIQYNDDDTLDFEYANMRAKGVIRDSQTGCYPLKEFGGEEYDYRLCEDGDSWRLMFDTGISKDFQVWGHLPFQKQTIDGEEGYYVNYPFAAFLLQETNDGPILTYEVLLNYSDTFDVYLAGGLNGFAQLELTKTLEPTDIVATEFLFRDKTDSATPEDIANPQTSDAIIKAIIIAGIGLVPAFVLRKQLSKRAN